MVFIIEGIRETFIGVFSRLLVRVVILDFFISILVRSGNIRLI